MAGAGGQAAFGDTPARNYTLSVWHPDLRAPGNTMSMTLAASAQDKLQTMTVRLRPVLQHNRTVTDALAPLP